MLHDTLCTQNHTDGCSWSYEIKKGVHDWTASAHYETFRRATAIIEYLEGMDTELHRDDLSMILTLSRGY